MATTAGSGSSNNKENMTSNDRDADSIKNRVMDPQNLQERPESKKRAKNKQRNRHSRNPRSPSRTSSSKRNAASSNNNVARQNDEAHDTRRSYHTENTESDYRVVPQPKDEKLGSINDPRGNDATKRVTKKASSRGTGRNTESFDPASTLVRPDLRIQVGSSSVPSFDKPLKHDDVVIVPELFGKQDDWSLYYKLVEEMTELQKEGTKGAEWIAWHEGAHLISKNPKGSKTFEAVIDRLCEYFHIRKESIGTRFNWYKDSSDWKPFHHDSAAFNPQRAKNQNITVGVSFGATRELAFIRAAPQQDGNKVKLYFPQTNNGVFSFGRDANILWKHGINALHPDEQDGKGRISIILWGLAQNVIEEEGSPPLLGSDGQGPHAHKSAGNRGRRNSNRRRSNHNN